MTTPADSLYCWRDVLAQHYLLHHFKNRLPAAVKAWLDTCEWTLIAGAGQAKMPLLVLRAPGRIRLREPILLALAESAHTSWGPLDLALYSAEANDPLRVLSQTLVDISRYQ